ncbi:N-acetylmuramoyl-L-alanine amidase AmpD [Methylophaga frappieri]|uniref:1,6-anhydro-N-acetylmuramyl-L-alanine amidase AmpD n=1 Tax=Methylophaga frappieri (strain ATCC BAA-2434 / DSM 25690 / JAM7) TaxID=754477 RepID=I1YEW6_METFJ|nr:1,6-anhydro-N-acetylmuramyl-L-alanine amidase AmpD [Methylophaga frappieri]AFJ01459.1 N-acetylmuramoyl-L-alanine amidase AmpD [Methylophaga frappieri]
MQIDNKTGWLDVAEKQCSPNQDLRPDTDDLTGIVIHNISLPPGQFGETWIIDLFLNRLEASAHPYFKTIAHLKVSSHLLIRRNGHIVQFVPFHRRAWHAGQSNWQGRDKCNDFTVGIELEGDDHTAFTDEQYVKLTAVIHCLVASYPKLNLDNITGHEHIAPGRKTDPGPFFDWARLNKMLQ